MPTIEPEINGLSIVLVGTFNPTIYQPAWFAGEKLLRKGESEAAKIELLHPDAAVVEYEGFRMQALQHQFVLDTVQEPYWDILRDLAVGTFTLLSHTPIRAFGINRNLHFRLPDEKTWHKFGDRLAPKEPWTPALHQPGLLSMTIKGLQARGEACERWMNVKVAPSGKVSPFGVYVQVNHHFEFDENAGQGTATLIANLQQHWKDTIENTTRIVDQLSNVAYS